MAVRERERETEKERERERKGEYSNKDIVTLSFLVCGEASGDRCFVFAALFGLFCL